MPPEEPSNLLDGDPTPPPTPSDPPADPTPPSDPPADPTPAPADPTPPSDPPADEPAPTPWFQGDQLPEDWREQVAGEDSKTLNMLKRVDGIPTLVKNYIEAQETIRKGASAPAGPPEDPAKLAEWRKEQGIPEEASGYDFKLDDGLVLGDDDREEMQPMLELMHGMNLNNEQANSMVDTFFKMQSAGADRVAGQDRIDQTEGRRLMEQNWGGDYETNINLIRSMITQEFPTDIVDDLIGARLANGKALFNEPGVMAAFAKIARTVNPTAALVPSGHNPMQTLNDKIKEYEGRMKDDPTWHKDAAAQKDYMEMLTAREQLNARHGG